MAISLNQAYDIAQKLSNEQLMQAYTNGTLPQFVLFSEMELRQKEQKNRAQAPTQTVAERLVGAPPESSGIMQAAPQVPPQTAARGGIARSSPLDMGYSEDLPLEAKKILSMRLKAMRELEEEPQYAAEGGQLESQVPAPAAGNKPLTSRELADMLLHPVMMTESGGRQSAVSPKGAVGVMQIMPGTGPEAAKIAGVQWDPKRFKTDADYNTRLGHAYLTSMIDRFGDTEKALAAYNMGPTRLSGVLERAKRTGTDWKTMIPRETQGYLGKILGSRQALLPPRQTPEGADAEVPARYGNDPAFGGFLIRDSGYKYPRQDNSVDKGLAALRSAQAIQGIRFNRGGPVYLQAGGLPEGDYAPSDYAAQSEQSAIEEMNRREEERQREELAREQEYLSRPFQHPQLGAKEKAARARAAKEPQVPIPFGATAREEEQLEQTGPSDQQFAPPGYRPITQEELRANRGSGIPSALPQGPMQPGAEGYEGVTIPPSGIPAASPPSVKPPGAEKPPAGAGGAGAGGAGAGGAGAGGAGAGGAGAGGAGEDQSFAQLMKQVQDTIGSKISDEMKDQMKQHQESLAQMKNDKVVDTLFAAAKTLAGQRRGSVNFADAVANAGLAAQEAQKRIYKAEDDMRKYRGELLKAQQEGDYKAATIAMNRMIEGEKSKRAMQTAIMQTNRLIQSQETSERKTNITTTSGRLAKIDAERAALEKAIGLAQLDPQKQFQGQSVDSLNAERARLESLRAQTEAELIYYQRGYTVQELEAEMKRRKEEAARKSQ